MPSCRRIAVEVEVGDRRGVTGCMRRAAGDNHPVDDLGDRRIPSQQPREIRKRPQRDDGDLAGIRADRLPHHLLRHVPAVQLGPRQIDAAQPVPAVHVERLFWKRSVVGGDSDPRQPRRIEIRHNRLQVAGGLLRDHVAADCGDGHHIQPRIEEGHGQGDGVVDPGIDIQDHLAWLYHGHDEVSAELIRCDRSMG
jgi:hypothetical protein